MKLCMFTPKGMDLDRGWPGKLHGDRIVQLAAQTLQAFFTGGGGAREHAEYALADSELRPPVLYPPTVRVFSPFERGDTPFFSFRSPHPILGPEEELVYPAGTEELDYGLALAAVIGAQGTIGGFTLANDWTARDLARAERSAGFGPSKSSDFGLSLGPMVVTPDEAPSGRFVARVNGKERCGADVRELVHPWPDLVAHAARNTELRPGDLLVARALGAGSGPALEPGDVVELEAEGIGILRTRIAPPVD
ncbi:MAG TPA: fumarylacetoacetate hydrolase family protein [Gaiellaceae bacterium]|jgi:2-keto-4-pentenoate hydratase/2-oxohepta-3-ene-1,7-dioic acid hydratase in catechol pathway|nr:fumarylacetoacetate hydrolase family protein [Gaiellaceae bacterium]